MNRRKFITTCAGCALASMGAMLCNNDGIKSSQYWYNNAIRHLEIHIAEHCNLKCKYCFHFSSIADKEFYDLDKFRQDIKRMSYVLNKQLIEVQLLGGEPLLNPQILEYVKYLRKCLPYTLIKISTNAKLLDNMDEAFWKTLNKYDIDIFPSVYPIKINWKSILDKANKYNVKVYASIITGERLTIDNIESNMTQRFCKISLSETKYKNIDKSKCLKRGCYAMYDGKIYPCGNIAYIRHFNKKFNTNFIVTEKDYIDLYKAENIQQVEDFLYHTKEFPFCKYCSLDYKQLKWEASDEHDISEWT